MARKTPDQASRRRLNETLNLRDSSGNPTSTPRATRSRTPPSCSSANRMPVTARRTRMPTNSDIRNPNDISDEEPSVSLTSATPRISRTYTPIVPSRSRGENDSERVNRVLNPLLQSADRNERPNDGAGESLQAGILQQLNTFFERQEQFNERLEQRILAFEEECQKEREKKASKRLPRALTANVREVYKSLVADDGRQVQWDFSKNFNGPENKNVNQQILAGVQSTDHETPVGTIKAATRAHFRTKWRQQVNKSRNAAQDVLKQQRVRSRLNTKKNQREKALNLSTSLAAEEKEQYRQFMKVDYMSSEHSMSESDEGEENENGYDSSDMETPKQKVFGVSTLQWCSPALTQVMHSLDRKSTRRRSAKGTNMLVERRHTGIISSRLAPDDASPFSLS